MNARLAQLVVYPIKSTRGTPLTSTAVEPWGLAGDRRWAIVDGQGQRVRVVDNKSIMTITATTQAEGELLLTAPGTPHLSVSVPVDRSNQVAVKFSRLEWAVEADPDAARWLSAVLGKPVRLIWLDDATRRPLSRNHGGREGESLSLADIGPLLLTSTSSLRQLDEWIAVDAAKRGESPPQPLDMMRFRPNVVVDTDQPFSEESWRRVRIGSVNFRVLEHCDRCAVTLFEPATLRRSHEPIRTLARYRRRDKRVYFGVRLVPETPGFLRVGDPVNPDPPDPDLATI